ncbi:MAG: hypothetical protein ABIG89_04775 [Candidatus Woesearchaeota archaeon]
MVLEQLGASVVQALGNLLIGIIGVIPGLLAAMIVLLVGYVLGWVVYRILDQLFIKIKFDENIIKKTGISKRVGDIRLGHILAVISKWYIFVLFLAPAASLVKLDTLSNFLLDLSYWIPGLIAALLIILFGILASDYVSSKIEHVRLKNASGVAYITKVIIMIFVILLALDQVGLNLALAQNTFLIVIGGVMFGIALAVGIGYGLALKDSAKKRINKWDKLF